jgi:hypothetical protein
MSEDTNWVIHLPTTLSTIDAATALTSALRDSLGHITVLDFGGVTLSEEDNQRVRHHVYCNRLRAGDTRCLLHHGHDHSCAGSPRPTPPTSPPRSVAPVTDPSDESQDSGT